MRIFGLLAFGCLLAGQSYAQTDDRVHARLHSGSRPGATTVNQAQAEALTLTLTVVAARPVQSWIRVAGTIDRTGKVLEALVTGPDAALVKTGQRVRAFPPSSKSSMYQAFVTHVVPRASGATVEASLTASGRPNTTLYVMEIVVERGPFLSVPNEAIIEEGDQHVVYVQQQPGEYVPQIIQLGIQGELYTQVTDGVKEGDQVVTFGSFFIDADHKLKGTEQPSNPAKPQ
jgi:multidrug efflux pump subunit AcrA (membrane-fusion protein)